jgi:hypothetical protein
MDCFGIRVFKLFRGELSLEFREISVIVADSFNNTLVAFLRCLGFNVGGSVEVLAEVVGA